MAKRVIARVITGMNIGGPAQQAIALPAALNGGEFRSTLFAGWGDPHEASLWGAVAAWPSASGSQPWSASTRRCTSVWRREVP